MIKNQKNRNLNIKIVKSIFILINPLMIPIIIITILFILICYITDIFYIGIKNEEKSNMKEEIKYYTTSEYTEEESENFFKSVSDFISGIFKTEIMNDADWPVVGSTTITSFYGYRTAPTTGASTFHSRHRYCST